MAPLDQRRHEPLPSPAGRRLLVSRVGAAVMCTVLGACTTQAWYHGMQHSQRQQCQRIDDREERTRCEKAAALSYDAYREQAAEPKKP